MRKGWDFKLAEALGFSVSDPARGRERCSQQKVAASMDQFDSESALHAAIGRRGHRELPPFGAMRHLGSEWSADALASDLANGNEGVARSNEAQRVLVGGANEVARGYPSQNREER